MKVHRFEISPDKVQAGRQIAGEFVRTNLHEPGCGLESCNCSPGFWISLSDGEVGLCAELTPDEVREILMHDTRLPQPGTA